MKESLNMTNQGIKEDWYTKWGQHYLLSLISAYTNQLCINFKDKGISHFGGGLFHIIRDEISDVFDNIPPPKQDIIRSHTCRRTQRVHHQVSAAPPISMRSYNTVDGSCCSHHSLIQDDNLKYIPIKDIKKGDTVMTYDELGYYTPSVIECVIKTRCPDGSALMVQIGNLQITPYHPIKIDNEWIFPIMVGKLIVINTPYIYSLIIKNRKSVIINNYIYATWGHNLKGPIIEHEYYGNNVINDMKQIPGYDMGIVYLDTPMIKRDKDNCVCKIINIPSL